jgi:hypothetical protein
MSGSAFDIDHHAALGMVDRCRLSGGSNIHPGHPTTDINALLSGLSRAVMTGKTPDINLTLTLMMADTRRSRQTSDRGIYSFIPGSKDERMMRSESMQGIQLGGASHVDTPMTELKQALGLMPVNHIPDRLRAYPSRLL